MCISKKSFIWSDSFPAKVDKRQFTSLTINGHWRGMENFLSALMSAPVPNKNFKFFRQTMFTQQKTNFKVRD